MQYFIWQISPDFELGCAFFSPLESEDNNYHLESLRIYSVAGSVMNTFEPPVKGQLERCSWAPPLPSTGGPQFRARPRSVAVRPRYPGSGGGGWARAAHSSPRGRGAQTMRGAALAPRPRGWLYKECAVNTCTVMGSPTASSRAARSQPVGWP